MPNSLAISRSRLNFILLTLIFKLALDVAYCLWVSAYPQMRLAYIPSSIWMIFFSYLLAIAPAAIIPIKSTLPSRFIIGFLYLVTYLPATTLMAFGGFPLTPLIWLALTFAFLFSLSRIKLNFRLPSFGKNSKAIIIFIFGFYLIAFLALVAKFGFKLPPGIFNVYAIRAEYKESLMVGGRLAGYFLTWMGGIIIPFIATWAIINRKMIILLVAILSQLEIYAIAGQKIHLFAAIFIIWILVGIRFFRGKLLHYTAFSFTFLVIVGGAMDYLLETTMVTELFTRRMFYVPAQLHYYYSEFFAQNPYTYLSQSNFFKNLLQYPYDLPIGNIIGDFYFWRPEMAAGANMWADAFASFGLAGMLIFTLLLWLLNNLIDGFSQGKNIYLVYALIAFPVRALNDTSLLSTMLTHGMILSLFFLMLLPKSQGDSG